MTPDSGDVMLLCIGSRDVVSDSAVDGIKQGLSGGGAPVEVKRFDKSGHLAHLDEREEYVTVRETSGVCGMRCLKRGGWFESGRIGTMFCDRSCEVTLAIYRHANP